MLDGITTGYEERFDFPQRNQPPAISYLLATVPRGGSTYFSHLLWQSGCLGAPLEYLNFEPAGHYGNAAGNPRLQMQFWRRALACRTSANGVFGIKGFPALFHDLQGGNPALLGEVMRFLLGPQSARKVIQLRRRDREAHAISYARAMLSGIWRQEQEEGGRPEPEYSPIAVERCLKIIDQQEQAWHSMYRDLGITPLTVWFEDVLEDGEAATAQVADYLGVVIDPGSKIEVPQIKKQSTQGAKQWAKEHADN